MAISSSCINNSTSPYPPEALRRYFPVDHVLMGVFELSERLYDVQINELTGFETWHSFEVVEHGERVGRFFLDLYARPNKRNGAWMDGCRSRRRDAQGVLHLSMAYLVCDFTPGVESEPALLTHDEVITLFHEFGHGLHHLLTRVEQAGVAGVNGVAWDAVELPSQYMENWCCQPQVLRRLTCHIDSNASLPDDLLARLIESPGSFIDATTCLQPFCQYLLAHFCGWLRGGILQLQMG